MPGCGNNVTDTVLKPGLWICQSEITFERPLLSISINGEASALIYSLNFYCIARGLAANSDNGENGLSDSDPDLSSKYNKCSSKISRVLARG